MAVPIDRRRFLYQTAAGVGALSAGLVAGCAKPGEQAKGPPPVVPVPDPDGVQFPGARIDYPEDRPNLVLVRFGGGVRRRETVQHRDKTYCPFILHELAEKRGVLYNNVEMADAFDHGGGDRGAVPTSHGQGTLFLLTGQYDNYEDVAHQVLADRFAPKRATLFEYLRRKYKILEHETLIVNGEDRIDEEFYTFSVNHLFGVNYRSTVLSLYGFKTFLLREQLKGDMPDKDREEKEKHLNEMVKRDYRAADEEKDPDDPELKKEKETSRQKLKAFWANWRDYYGDNGLVNPRGDRLLTSLTLRAMKELRPRMMMINYQDPDYVHWGNPQFYTRAISIIDDGVREIYEAAQADEFYRDRTVFLVVPDCGRDNNPGMAVPFQHHFNSKCAHEIFAVLAGPDKFLGGLRGNDPGKSGPPPIVKPLQQIYVASTVGKLMGFDAHEAVPESLLL